MDFVLNVLETEKKRLETELTKRSLMQINMQKARMNMANIAQIKQAMKIINAKIKGRN